MISGIETDSGKSATDGITNDSSITVHGTAESNVTINVYDGTQLLGTATADGTGNWSFPVSGTLADGSTHTYKATASDGGATSGDSNQFVVRIDTTAPAVPVVIGVRDDNGKSSSDGITNDTSLSVYGTTEANACVTVYDGGSELGVAIADGSGNWSFPVPGTLTDGSTHSYTARAMDVAGNTGSESPPPPRLTFLLTRPRLTHR